MIGDAKAHRPTKRNKLQRMHGYGHEGNFALYERFSGNKTGRYPLWLPFEFRELKGGESFKKVDESPTAFHFHNMFMSIKEIRFKYATYGHPHRDAHKKPLQNMHGDLNLAITCGAGNPNEDAAKGFEDIPGTSKPIYYLNEEVRQARHNLWKEIVSVEEERLKKT